MCTDSHRGGLGVVWTLSVSCREGGAVNGGRCMQPRCTRNDRQSLMWSRATALQLRPVGRAAKDRCPGKRGAAGAEGAARGDPDELLPSLSEEGSGKAGGGLKLAACRSPGRKG